MEKPRPRVAVAESFAEIGQDVLRRSGIDLVTCVGFERERLLDVLHDCDGLIVRSETRVDAALLQAGPRLRVVGRAGAGVDAIDVTAATSAGIVVVNTPAANTIAATEHTFALILASLRQVSAAHASLLSGEWERGRFTGRELFGKTLGVIGLGRIGGSVAARAHAFGMSVIACDPFIATTRAEAVHARLVSLPELLARADIVTLHVPFVPQTDRLIDAEKLAMMRTDALFVNCSRGGVVDEPALLDALDAGSIRAAAIDVVREEPPSPGSTGARLHKHPKVVATPHLGGSTHEALARIAVELAQDIANVLVGRPAMGAVNAPSATGLDAEIVRPYVDAAYRLGKIAAQIFDETIRLGVTLVLRGTISAAEPAPLRAAFLSGLLQLTSERRISAVNAESVAAEIGLELRVRGDEPQGAFSASLEVVCAERRLVAIASNAGTRVVEIDGFEVDAVPDGALLITRHDDVPGMVGRVGTILGNAGANISTMQVARDSRGALMVLSVDRALSREAIAQLQRLPDMRRVEALTI
ncbi:MAG: phosphoglycerate dehydrogenase [Candidatus Eremiobacteraeota bacterium]|nr:phosphoglycerate dehydrogenase [Candidatus Eremiobacteraeota bacterium]